MLAVKFSYGLSNRLMPLLSALRIAEIAEKRMVAVWEKDHICFANLSDLFETDFDVMSKDDFSTQYGRDGAFSARWQDQDGKLLFIPLRSALKEDVFLEPNHFFYLDSDASYVQFHRRELARQMRSHFLNLRLNRDVSEMLRPYDTALSRGIGLHVRRTYPNASWDDRFVAERNRWDFPNNDQYLHLIRYVRAQTGLDGPVFLSTNCSATKAFFLDALNGDVLFHPSRSLDNHTSVESIQDAMVDLIALSRAPLIIRYSESTFAQASAVIGKTKQIIIYSNNTAVMKNPLEY